MESRLVLGQQQRSGNGGGVSDVAGRKRVVVGCLHTAENSNAIPFVRACRPVSTRRRNNAMETEEPTIGIRERKLRAQ